MLVAGRFSFPGKPTNVSAGTTLSGVVTEYYAMGDQLAIRNANTQEYEAYVITDSRESGFAHGKFDEPTPIVVIAQKDAVVLTFPKKLEVVS